MGNLLDENSQIATKEMLKALDAQRSQLEKINVLMDPKILKERVKLDMELTESKKELLAMEEKEQITLALNQTSIQKRIKQEQDLLKLRTELSRAEQKELHKHEVKALKKELQDPSLVAERIRKEQEITELRKQISLAEDRERQKYDPAKSVGAKTAIKGTEIVAGGVTQVSNTLGQLNSSLGPVSAGLGAVSSAMKTVAGAAMAVPVVGEVVAALAIATSVISDQIDSILNSLTRMAGLASPAQMKMFQMAVEDTQAVIGGSFLPVLELMRDGIRLTGDVLANFLPNSAEVREALSEMMVAFQETGTAIRQAMVEMGPGIRQGFITTLQIISNAIAETTRTIREIFKGSGQDIMDIMKLIGPVLKDGLVISLKIVTNSIIGMVFALKSAVYPITLVVKALQALGLISPDVPGTGEARTSFGAAARQAQFSSIDQYQQQLQLAAFSTPGTPTAASVPAAVDSINQILLRWSAILTPSGIATALALELAGPLGRLAGETLASRDAASEAAGGAAGRTAAEIYRLLFGE